jgi:hypothetical protein
VKVSGARIVVADCEPASVDLGIRDYVLTSENVVPIGRDEHLTVDAFGGLLDLAELRVLK